MGQHTWLIPATEIISRRSGKKPAPSKKLNFHPQQRIFKYEPVPKYLQ